MSKNERDCLCGFGILSFCIVLILQFCYIAGKIQSNVAVYAGTIGVLIAVVVLICSSETAMKVVLYGFVGIAGLVVGIFMLMLPYWISVSIDPCRHTQSELYYHDQAIVVSYLLFGLIALVVFAIATADYSGQPQALPKALPTYSPVAPIVDGNYASTGSNIGVVNNGDNYGNITNNTYNNCTINH